MIKAIEKNLQRGINLLNAISEEEYSNSTIPPYFSSIGCHMRHVLDVFSCVINGIETKYVDFSVRERNELAEIKTEKGLEYFYTIIQQLKNIDVEEFTSKIKVIDDLGLGKVTVESTVESVLMQAQSHAIHHFASIGYIIHQLEIELPDADFGFNPTTPKLKV